MDEPETPHFAIVAGTLTGNRGAEAMVTTCIEQIKLHHPDAVVHVLSYYPEEDRAERPEYPDVFVHSSTPARLVLEWLPGSLLARVVPLLKHRATRSGASIFGLLDCSAVLDVAGVSFIDGREKFLPFNVLTLVPFMLHGVPVFKMSQAMGPITSTWNRLSAGLVLPRARLVFARGESTLENLRRWRPTLGNVLPAPDVTFLLAPKKETPYAKRKKRVGLIPSSLVLGKLPDYAEKMAALATLLREAGYEVTLVCHSHRAGSTSARNNDLLVAHDIARRVSGDPPVEVLGDGLNARELKAEIGKCQAVVTSRFHGMVAALGTSTPTFVIGWSHKYQEVLDRFGVEGACVDYAEFDPASVAQRVQQQLATGAEHSSRLAAALTDVKQSCREQFERVFDSLRS